MFSTPVGDAGYLFEQVYGENAQKFLFRDEDELTQKLTEFIQQQPSYVQILKRAEAICKQEYSWENVAAQTFNVYRDAQGDNEEGNA
jgi:glycosyltransferase involved in cell wall biosynthesis